MKLLYYLAILLFCGASLYSQPITTKKVLENIEIQLPAQKKILGKHYSEYEKLLKSACSKEEQGYFKFIIAYSPLSDLADYSPKFLLDNTKLALATKRLTPWGKAIPEDVFLHFVLPPRVNNENLDSFRIQMRDTLLSRINGLSMYDAALEVNHWCHEKVTYKGSDARTSSPLSTIKYSFGRCGEESTLLVAALRTAGIPARQVYTPRWAHCDDNHAWVEVWVNGKWYFMGACEPSPELNMGWFAGPATRTMLVNTRVFGAYFGSEDVISREARFSELNVISNYQDAKIVNIKVTDEQGKSIENAKVEFLLYNYAEFFTLASIYTANNGTCNFQTGYGDLLIRASKDGKYNIKKLSADMTTLNIAISDDPNLDIANFEITPPKLGKIVDVSTQNEKINAERLLREDSIRAIYIDSFLDSAEAEIIIESIHADNDRLNNYIVTSFGNSSEILDFIKRTDKKYSRQAIDLLSVISAKDLRDTRSYILSNHLNSALQYYKDFKDKEIWKKYVLSGRIYIEMMNDWRSIGDSVLTNWLNVSKSDFAKNKIDFVLKAIQMLTIDSIANAHSRAPLTPKGVYHLQYADPISRDIFFVALCRSLGIAARLNETTAIPQYYDNGKWNDISFVAENDEKQDYGFVHFINKSNFEPKYYSNFTIGRVVGTRFKTIEYDDIIPLSEMDDKIEVPAGKYILTTGNRDADGKVYVLTLFFDVKANTITDVEVKVRDLPNINQKWADLDLNQFECITLGDSKVKSLSELCKEEPFIIALIEPDKEPTKHVMADFIANPAPFDSWKGNLIFLLETENTREDFDPNFFNGIPQKSVYAWDKEGKLLKEISRLRKENNLLKDMPIILFGNAKSELLYFSKGYKIGTVNDLEKLLK